MSAAGASGGLFIVWQEGECVEPFPLLKQNAG